MPTKTTDTTPKTAQKPVRLISHPGLPGRGVLTNTLSHIGHLLEIHEEWNSQPYKYGGKSVGVSVTARANNPVPVDCSGYFGMLLDAITRPLGSIESPRVGTDLHDMGSWQQWRELQGYRSITGLKLKPTKQFTEKDRVIRAFYLTPDKTASGIGHIGLVLDGLTIESCGSLGVCRRLWDPKTYRWMRHCDGLVLTVPEGFGGEK